MKRLLFNVTFTAIFLGLFSLILYTFSDKLVGALTSTQTLYPKDESLEVDACQKWVGNIRDFQIGTEAAANRLTVLVYNGIVNTDSPQSSSVLASEFEQQMAFLAKNHYTSLTAKEFYLYMKNELVVPQNSIFITFDDGYKNNFSAAYPILKKYKFTAVNFIDTSQITKKNSQSAQRITVQDLQKGCDVFDFQSHTYNFHQRNDEGEAYLVSETKKAIQKDIGISLVNLKKEDPIFAYPFGEYDNETIEVLKLLNIKMAFTTEGKDARPGMDLYKIPRKMILPEDTLEDFKKKINK